MSIDEELRRSATAVREDAARLVGSMSPPRPSSSGGKLGAPVVAIAVTLVLVVGLGLLVAVRERPAPATDTGRMSPFVPILDRPGYFRYDSERMEFWLPSSGWTATSETLTPNIGELDGVDAYRDADTIVSLSTRPLAETESAATTTNCQTIPFAALAALAPTDALVSVVETSATALPDRRRATGIYEGEPERLYPTIGEVKEDWCLDQVRRRGDADLFYRQYTFTDAGRSFTVHVALGSATATSEQHEAWRILDRFAFDPAPTPAPN